MNSSVEFPHCVANLLIIVVTTPLRYNTVLSCWDRSPDSRPTFSELVLRFTASLSNVADYFDLVVSRPSSSMAVGNCDEFETTVRVLDNGIGSHSRQESVTSL